MQLDRDEEFWEDLLTYIEEGRVIPVIGEGAVTFGPDNEPLSPILRSTPALPRATFAPARWSRSRPQPKVNRHMFSTDAIQTGNKPEFYAELSSQLRAMLTGERDWLANLANTAALIFHTLPDLNWAGFYLLHDGEGELVLGPFQGKPACVRIAPGRGVCGGAVVQRRSLVVPDVHAFPGHIACDAASRSELVVPMILPDGRVVGVLDLDSPQPGRFDDDDRVGCEALVAELLAATEWTL